IPKCTPRLPAEKPTPDLETLKWTPGSLMSGRWKCGPFGWLPLPPPVFTISDFSPNWIAEAWRVSQYPYSELVRRAVCWFCRDRDKAFDFCPLRCACLWRSECADICLAAIAGTYTSADMARASA